MIDTEWFIAEPWSCYIVHPLLSTIPYNHYTNNDITFTAEYGEG